jgi:hypothetical protein
MQTTELIPILNNINMGIKKSNIVSEKRKEKYINELESLINEYDNIEVPEKLSNVYNSLVKKGKELQKEVEKSTSANEINEKIQYYIRYLKAAKADFTGNYKYINKYYRTYLFTCVLFLALSPQYYGFILPAIFFVPIFLGIRGIKNRSRLGFQLSLAVIPVALMTSFTWIRYGLYVLNNYNNALLEVINANRLSPTTARLLVTVPPILAVILFILAIVQAFRAYKSKDLFV